jgi:methionyl-tRNA formyltransferase
MDETIDAGPLLTESPVLIYPHDTAFTLWNRSKDALLLLFKEVVQSRLWIARPMADCKRHTPGILHTKSMYEKNRQIRETQATAIERKIRAYWHPPFLGAYFQFCGKRYYPIPEAIAEREMAACAQESKPETISVSEIRNEQ